MSLERRRVLVVEDDERLGRQIVACLTEAGFDPHWVRDGREAMDYPSQGLQLAILDLMLPGADGFAVLEKLRRHSDVPVLVLSARNEAADKVRSLQLGADDYMTKPFWPEELVERVRARLRRPILTRDNALEAGDLTIELEKRRVYVKGEEAELTRTEFELLSALARRPGAAVSRRWLLENVLDPDREATERTLDVHVSRLRKKLGTAGNLLVTVWGVGYRLELNEP